MESYYFACHPRRFVAGINPEKTSKVKCKASGVTMGDRKPDRLQITDMGERENETDARFNMTGTLSPQNSFTATLSAGSGGSPLGNGFE